MVVGPLFTFTNLESGTVLSVGRNVSLGAFIARFVGLRMALYTDQGAPCEITPPGRNDLRLPRLRRHQSQAIDELRSPPPHVCSALLWSRGLATSSSSGGPLVGRNTVLLSIFSPSVSAGNESSRRTIIIGRRAPLYVHQLRKRDGPLCRT